MVEAMDSTLRQLYSEAEKAGVEELGSMSLLRPTTKGMLAFIPTEDSHEGVNHGINDGVTHDLCHEQHHEHCPGYNDNNNDITDAQHGWRQEAPSLPRIRPLERGPRFLLPPSAKVRGIEPAFTVDTPQRHSRRTVTPQRDSQGAGGTSILAGNPSSVSPRQTSQRGMPIIFDGPLPPRAICETSCANWITTSTKNITPRSVPLVRPFSRASGWTPLVLSKATRSQVLSQVLSGRTSARGDEKKNSCNGNLLIGDDEEPDHMAASTDENIVSTDDEGMVLFPTRSYSTLSGEVFQEHISREWRIDPELPISPCTPGRVYPLNLLLVNRTVSDDLVGRVFVFFIRDQVLRSHEVLMGDENSKVKFITMLKRVAGVPVYAPMGNQCDGHLNTMEDPEYSDENGLADENRACRERDEFLSMLHQHYCNGDGRLVAKVLAVLEFWLFGHPESKPYSIFRNKKKDEDEKSDSDLPPIFHGKREDSDFLNQWAAFLDQHSEFSGSDGRVLRWKSTVDLYLQGFSGVVANQNAAAEQNGAAEQNENSNGAAGYGANVHNADYHNHNANNSGAQSNNGHNANNYGGYYNQRLGPARRPSEIFKDLLNLQLPGFPVVDFYNLEFSYDIFLQNFRSYEQELYVFVDRYLGDEQKLNFICNEYGI